MGATKKQEEKPVSPMVIADYLWDSTNPMVTSCMDKKSYQIGAMEAVKYMRNNPQTNPNETSNS